MTETDLAYAAGIIDGEGCIGIYKRNARNQTAGGDGRRTYRGSIHVAMCEPIVIEFLHKLFGGSISRIRVKGPRSRDQFAWSIAAIQGGRCAELVLPFLLLKKHQALNLIELQSINKFIRDSTTLQRKQRNGFKCWKGAYEIDPSLLARCAELYIIQRALNLRGIEKPPAVVDSKIWRGPQPVGSIEHKRRVRKAWTKQAYDKRRESMTAEELAASRAHANDWWKREQAAALAGDKDAQERRENRLQKRRDNRHQSATMKASPAIKAIGIQDDDPLNKEDTAEIGDAAAAALIAGFAESAIGV